MHIVEDAPASQAGVLAAGEQDGDLIGTVRIAIKQVGTHHQDGAIQQRRAALVNRLHLLHEVGILLHVELIGFEVHGLNLRRVAVMGKVEVQRAADAFDELEVHLRQIVVQHQAHHARLVHLEGEHDEIEHELHVGGHVLRNLVGRTWHVRLLQGGAPTFEALFLRSALNAFLDIAH